MGIIFDNMEALKDVATGNYQPYASKYLPSAQALEVNGEIRSQLFLAE